MKIRLKSFEKKNKRIEKKKKSISECEFRH
jgi:hypothetical protein